MRKSVFFFLCVVVPIVFFSFGRTSSFSSQPVLDEVKRIFSFSQEELAILDLPQTMLAPCDFFLEEDLIVKQLFSHVLDSMERERETSCLEEGEYAEAVSLLCRVGEEGHFLLEGTQIECRTIAIFMERLFEKAFADFLFCGLLQEVNVVFLANAPSTCLMVDEWMPWALQDVVREKEKLLHRLVALGANVLLAYSAKQSEKSQQDVWETKSLAFFSKEEEGGSLIACPLRNIDPIPEERIGVFYTLVTAEGNLYYFFIRKLVAKKEGEGLWEIGMASGCNPLTRANQARIQTLFFIFSHGYSV